MLAFCSLSLGFASMPDLGEVHYDLRLSFGDDPLQTLDLYKTSAAAEGMPPAPCIIFVGLAVGPLYGFSRFDPKSRTF